MIHQVKKYTYIGLAVALLGVLPYALGWMTLFSINIEIKPIDINMYIVYALIAFFGYNAWWTIKIVKYNDWIIADDQEPESEVEFHIEDSGAVIYDPITELENLQKRKLSPSEWSKAASRFPSKKYPGDAWNKVRTYCLTQRQKAMKQVTQ